MNGAETRLDAGWIAGNAAVFTRLAQANRKLSINARCGKLGVGRLIADGVCLAKIRSAFEMNEIRESPVTIYMDDIQP